MKPSRHALLALLLAVLPIAGCASHINALVKPASATPVLEMVEVALPVTTKPASEMTPGEAAAEANKAMEQLDSKGKVLAGFTNYNTWGGENNEQVERMLRAEINVKTMPVREGLEIGAETVGIGVGAATGARIINGIGVDSQIGDAAETQAEADLNKSKMPMVPTNVVTVSPNIEGSQANARTGSAISRSDSNSEVGDVTAQGGAGGVGQGGYAYQEQGQGQGQHQDQGQHQGQHQGNSNTNNNTNTNNNANNNMNTVNPPMQPCMPMPGMPCPGGPD